MTSRVQYTATRSEALSDYGPLPPRICDPKGSTAI